MNLLEAFQALDSLNEDTFSVDTDGIKKLQDFIINDDSVDELSVFDLEAEDDEAAAKTCHDGDLILNCSVCHSDIYKPADKVVTDDESGLACVGMECPYCFSTDGYKIRPFKVIEVSKDEMEAIVSDDEQDADNEIEIDLTDIPTDDVNESLKESKELSTVEGTLGNVLDIHKDELSRLTSAKEISAFLERVKPEIKKDQQAYVDSVIAKVKRLPDMKALKYMYDIVLKGDNLSSKMDANKQHLIASANESLIEALNKILNNLTEATISDEDKADSDIIRGMLQKLQNRSNAAFTPEEQAIMQKYNINRNNTSRNLTVDGRDLAREVDTNQNYYSSKNNGNPEKINYADRARKLSQRKDNQIFNHPYSVDNDDINVHGYKRVNFSDLQDAERYNQNVQMQESVNTMKNELRNRSHAQNRIDNAEKNRADRMAKAQAAFDKAKANADWNYNYDTEYSAKERDIAQADIDKLLKRRTNESLEEIEIKTDDTKMEVAPKEDGEIQISVKPRESEAEINDVNEKIEILEPLSDEEKEEIELNVDSIDKETFDEIGESFLKENYSNVKFFHTGKIRAYNNSFLIEGIIGFNSGKKKLTKFLFESKSVSKNKITFLGENFDISSKKQSLYLTGTLNANKVVCESLKRFK